MAHTSTGSVQEKTRLIRLTGYGLCGLDNWETYLPKFVKVMPVDYRKALEQMQKEQMKEAA